MRQQLGTPLLLMIGSVVALAVAACRSSSSEATSPIVTEALSISAVTPTTLSGSVGTPVDPVPAVRVTDRSGRPLAEIAITFEITAGQGSLTGAATRTESDGTARLGGWTLGTISTRPNVVRARLSGDTTAWVEFTASAAAGSIAYLVAIGGDAQAGFSGSVLSDPLSVKVLDLFGNAIVGAVVAFLPSSNNGTIDAPAATSDHAGIARSGLWTLGSISGAQRAEATAGAAKVAFTAIGVVRCTTDCPMGHRLVYVRQGDIYAMNTDGTEEVRLTATGTNSEPTWSPDGSRIAFVRNSTPVDGFSSAIHLMDANGGNVRLFATDALSPAWSPDGKTLAYSEQESGEFKIFVAAVDGGSSRQVGFTRGYNRWAAWSPDGAKLAFISDYSAFDFAFEVYVMNADGSNIAQLTNGFGNSTTLPSYTMYAQPVWSPDGRRIALVSCRAWQYALCDESAIAIMSADGSRFHDLVTAGGYAKPTWSADGSFLSYAHTCRSNDCSPTIYVIPAVGGSERLLIPAGHSAEWRR